MKKLLLAAGLAALYGTAGTALAAPLPSGWTCTGNCGTPGPGGVVTAAAGYPDYGWGSTSGGGLGKTPWVGSRTQ